MATTTPNFGWSVPTSTDLVKDGATAIETLGDSIDASFVDLKGGTTGQVLSKASGTDLDFTWVTDAAGDITGVTAGTGISGGGTSGTVTVTNSMATAIDAKGDLVVGTGADAFSRLAVGTNGQALVADSAEATGLKWGSVSSGMTLITTQTVSGVTAQSINSCFSSTYDNYLIVANLYCATAADVPTMKLRASGTDSTSGYYSGFFAFQWTGGGNQSDYSANEGTWRARPFGQISASSTNRGGTYMTLSNPFLAQNTSYSSNYLNAGTSGAAGFNGGVHNVASSYDGFTITNPTAMTGTVRVYGLAN